MDASHGRGHRVGDDLGLCVLSGKVPLSETRQGGMRPTGSHVSQAPSVDAGARPVVNVPAEARVVWHLARRHPDDILHPDLPLVGPAASICFWPAAFRTAA